MYNYFKNLFKKKIRLGVFNIQNLSNKKISDKNIFNNLVNIIHKYDMIYILELVDKEALQNIIKKLNSHCYFYNKYDFKISQKTGLTPQSAEYYGLIYKKNNISIVTENILLCDDTKFDRMPWFTNIKIKNMNIKCFINHISPNNVDKELNHLNYIFNLINLTDPNGYYILLGDYNADLPYLAKKDRIIHPLFINNNITNITNELVTNIAKNEKKYDKIFVSNNLLNYLNIINFNANATGIKYDKYCNIDNIEKLYNLDPENLKKISDHYPIYMELYI
jgi:hypothetical protein